MRRRNCSGVIVLFVLFTCSLAKAGEPHGSIERTEGSDFKLLFFDDLMYLGTLKSTHDPFEERIETERHDFTQSSKTVGRGVTQVETGYTYFYHDQDEEIEQSHTLPELLVRVGLTDNIEFRLHWSYAWGFVGEGDNIDSAEDLRWSFKLGMTEEDRWIPESALEVRSTVPTGGSAFSTKRVEFGLDYIYKWQIAEGWELSGSTGFGTDGLDDFGLVPEDPASDRFVLWSQSIAIGTKLTDQITVYNEFFGLFSHGLEQEYSMVFFNMGLDYYVTKNFILDIRAGVGLTPDSDDLFTGIGGGYRF